MVAITRSATRAAAAKANAKTKTYAYAPFLDYVLSNTMGAGMKLFQPKFALFAGKYALIIHMIEHLGLKRGKCTVQARAKAMYHLADCLAMPYKINQRQILALNEVFNELITNSEIKQRFALEISMFE